jgi:hypothetical protein
VLGGLQLMGFWGVFIGPVVAALLHGLIKIFNAELVALSQERLANRPASATVVTDAGRPVVEDTVVSTQFQAAVAAATKSHCDSSAVAADAAPTLVPVDVPPGAAPKSPATSGR